MLPCSTCGALFGSCDHPVKGPWTADKGPLTYSDLLAALDAEREACIKIVESDLPCHTFLDGPAQFANAKDWVYASRKAIAAAIRARGQE